MCYFTRKLELVSNILWMIVGCGWFVFIYLSIYLFIYLLIYLFISSLETICHISESLHFNIVAIFLTLFFLFLCQIIGVDYTYFLCTFWFERHWFNCWISAVKYKITIINTFVFTLTIAPSRWYIYVMIKTTFNVASGNKCESVVIMWYCDTVILSCHPSKHLLVLKTSSTRLQRNNFTSSKTFWRRLKDVLKTFSRPLAKRLQDVFKTSLRQTKLLLVISVSKKSKCVSNKSLFHRLYLRNLRRIQNASLSTQQFRYSSYFETLQHFYFQN